MQIRIHTRYSSEDPKCNSDYCAVEVFIDNQLVKEWGDDYHDKGKEKAEGFVEGIKWMSHEEVEVTETQSADYVC